MSGDFREGLAEIAQRAIAAAPRCLNEEATKMFLVLPVLKFLGYDPYNPHEVIPEHHADFSDKYKNRVDLAIFKNDSPIIALECKCVGSTLKDERGQLRSYFNAAKTVKMGMLTDGLIWEFYADSDEPNIMDDAAFLSIDLREVAKGKIEDSAVQGLKALQKTTFDPENIGAEARRKHVFNAVFEQIKKFSEEPDDQLCRILLQKAGVTHLRQKNLGSHKDIIKQAFREFVNHQIILRLDLPSKEQEKQSVVSAADSEEKTINIK